MFPINNQKISLIVERYSGSNTLALYKYLPDDIKSKFDVSLVDLSPVTFGIGTSNKNDLLKSFLEISRSKVIITDHGSRKLKGKQININTWHGFPIKSMGKMALGEAHLKIHRPPKVDYNISYSQLYSVLLSACFGFEAETFKILGAPRNDFLFKSIGTSNLKKLLNVDIDEKKTILFMPTFRQGYKGIEGERKNVFGLEDFNQRELNSFLKLNNAILIIKPHIVELPYLIKELGAFEGQNIFVLTDEICKSNHIDFYEVLNAVDILVTDYSSVYFDFLLLDRPIIFIPTELNIYLQKRGLLLEPYDFWTPGPKVFTQKEFQKKIVESLKDPFNYSFNRNMISDIVHKFKDGNSAKRVWDFVRSLLT